MVTTHSNDGAIHLSLDTPQRHMPLDGFPEPPAWMADAVCATTDPEAFYPEKGGSTAAAKKVCSGCIVQAECLDWALDRDERFGIWGGLSERERRRIKPPRPPVIPSGFAARVRDWATCQNLPVSPTGRLPSAVVEQYLEQHPHDTAIHDSTTQESA